MNNSYRILFVDDSTSIAFQINSNIELDKLPVRPTFCENPAEALEYLREVDRDKFPDCIISDIHMPLMDGFEFADQYLAEFLFSQPETLFFIASSSYHPTDLDIVKAHPCIKGFLEKPLTKKEFEEQVFPALAGVTC